VDTSTVAVIALLILVPAAILWIVFLARNRRPSPAKLLGIPQAMRPGEPDEVLEGPRLERILWAGLISTFLLALFVAVYWLGDLDRQEAFAERFNEESVERGAIIFAEPPELPEESDPQEFREVEREISLGMGCARCHGASANLPDVPEEELAAGGQVAYQDPITGKTVQYAAPPLNNVFTRWDSEVIQFTIERGRPGTPMPAWGVEYGGPMTEQMITDVMAWIESLPGNQQPPEGISESCENPSKQDLESCGEEIFTARCAVCHGPEAQGKESEPWYQGMALWKGDVRHLTKDQHLATVVNGRRFAFMPPFGETPAQGIEVPPYPLTQKQIQAVVAYERSL
jgi:mono/diheme cytochrome c family protein